MRTTMKHATTSAALFVVLFAAVRAWQGQGTQPAGGRGDGPAGPPAPTRHRIRAGGTGREQRPQARLVSARRRSGRAARRAVDRRLGMDGGHRQANRARRRGSTATPAGYAVAGVSIRSSSQVQFPGQLYDIKAAIRWLRANAAKYGLDPDRIAHHGRQLRRLDHRDGRADRRRARDWRARGHDWRVQHGAGGRGLLPAHELPDDGRLGAEEVQRGRRVTTTTARPSRAWSAARFRPAPTRCRPPTPLSYVTAADPPMMILHGGSDRWCRTTRASSSTWR